MMTLPEAIAREEGFYVIGSRAQRNNNPGNLCSGEFTTLHGATGSDSRFAIFPTAVAGFACLSALLTSPAYIGLNLSKALNKYAPPVENATNSYISNVCAWVGCTPETPLTELL
jgi:hypothetical protein